MIDTLKISKRLQQQGLAQTVSDEKSEILREFGSEELASKSNLKELEYALKKDLELTKAELQKELHETKAELQKEIQVTKTDLQKEIQITKSDLQKEIRLLDIKISESATCIIKWVAAFLVGQTALLFTLIRVFG